MMRFIKSITISANDFPGFTPSSRPIIILALFIRQRIVRVGAFIRFSINIRFSIFRCRDIAPLPAPATHYHRYGIWRFGQIGHLKKGSGAETNHAAIWNCIAIPSANIHNANTFKYATTDKFSKQHAEHKRYKIQPVNIYKSAVSIKEMPDRKQNN